MARRQSGRCLAGVKQRELSRLPPREKPTNPCQGGADVLYLFPQRPEENAACPVSKPLRPEAIAADRSSRSARGRRQRGGDLFCGDVFEETEGNVSAGAGGKIFPENRSQPIEKPRIGRRNPRKSKRIQARFLGLAWSGLVWLGKNLVGRGPRFPEISKTHPLAGEGPGEGGAGDRRLLPEDQDPVALLDADQPLEEARADQVHVARLGREDEGLDLFM